MTSDAKLTPVSWNTHALLTRFALRSAEWDFLDIKCSVVPLQELLFAAGNALQKLVRRHAEMLAAKGCNAVPGMESLPDIVTPRGFLEALRLNPEFSIHYVRSLKLREVPADSPHDASRSGPPSPAYVPTPVGELISARRILSTFSDEPDWGIDQDLFLIPQYGYGPQPYGPPTGVSSQAPFHMAFFFEPRPLLWAMPSLRRNFMEERIRLFFALADLAFLRGIDYWGWRFTAWAMHYLQDLTQPYHARALPFSIFRLLKRLIRAGRLSGLAERHGNILRNRHMLFEAAVHWLLNDALKRGSHRKPVKALSHGNDWKAQDVNAVMKQSAKIVSRLAARVNAALETLMREPRLNDPSYSLDHDRSYRIDLTLPQAALDRPESFERFLSLVAVCLSEAGTVTRYAVRTGASSVVSDGA
ncbi:MAG: hypothetical protein LDL33_07420 [Desulfomonile sp.]|nr:hypothetical protein [Desulfomonile sp.]